MTDTTTPAAAPVAEPELTSPETKKAKLDEAAAPAAPAPAAGPVTLDEETIRKAVRQLNFYFGNSNLPEDTFLKTKVASNPEGFVDLALLLTFKNMRQILKLEAPKAPSAELIAAVAAALIAHSTELVVSDDKLRVRRKEPLPAVLPDTTPRTVYFKGWNKHAEPSIDEMFEFFGKFGNVVSVRARHYTDDKKKGKKLFKGTMLIEYDTEEAAKKVVELKPELPEKGRVDLPGWKSEWMMAADWKAQKVIEDASKAKQEEETKKAAAEKKAAAAASDLQITDAAAAAPAPVPLVPGCVIKVTGFEKPVDAYKERTELKTNARAIAAVRFVGREPESTEALIRCNDPAAAQTLLKHIAEHADDFVAFAKGLKAVLLEGEEEKTFLEKAQSTFEKTAETGGNRGGRGRGRGRGRGGRGRGGRGGRGRGGRGFKRGHDDE